MKKRAPIEIGAPGWQSDSLCKGASDMHVSGLSGRFTGWAVRGSEHIRAPISQIETVYSSGQALVADNRNALDITSDLRR